MTQIVNLNRARKAKSRRDEAAGAAENRVKFGLTKASKASMRAQRAAARRVLDQAKREP